MAVSAELKSHVGDLLAPLGDVKFKRFFSGAGFYHKERLLGFIIRDRVYLKTDDTTRRDFEREGAGPFTFKKHTTGETISTSYFEVPARVFEDPDEMTAWARRAYAVALRTTAPKSKHPSRGNEPPADLPLVTPKKPAAKKVTAAKARSRAR